MASWFLHSLGYASMGTAPLRVPMDEPVPPGFTITRMGDVMQVCRAWAALMNGACDDGVNPRFVSVAEAEAAVRSAPRDGGASPWPATGTPVRYHDDKWFSGARVAGPNPVAIRRLLPSGAVGAGTSIDRLPPELQLTDAEFAAALAVTLPGPAPAFAAALNAGRLYITDYRDQANLGNGAYKFGQKYQQGVVGLFYSPPGEVLRPVAIWLPIGGLVRVGEPRWEEARVWHQVADTTHHELSSHLGRAHFVMLGIAKAVHAELRPGHPIRQLLTPCLTGVWMNMEVGAALLTEPKGMLEELFAPSAAESVAFAHAAVRSWSFALLNPRTEVARRGCADPALLSFYPYRDDAFLLWDAMLAYASTVVRGIYGQKPLDPDVVDLFNALRSAFPGSTEGLVESVDGLAFLVAGAMFCSGPYHAAVNYPQFDQTVVVPAVQPASYSAPSVNAVSRVDMLPPKAALARQVELMHLLAGRRFGSLLDLPALKGFEAAHAQFEVDLRGIQNRIAETHRPFPYLYLAPDRVPPAANV